MKKLYAIIPSLLTYSLLAAPAFAQRGIDPCVSKDANLILKATCNLGSGNLGTTVGNIIIAIIVIAVIIALLYLLYGGIRWIMSRGEKTEVEAARNHIVAAIVGLLVIFLAIFIIAIVLGIFGIQISNLELPKII